MKIYFILLATLSFYIFACSEADEAVQAEHMDITESVYSSVTIYPDSLYQVFSSTSGYLSELYVDEGDTVQRGQSLFRIRNLALKYNLDNLSSSYEQARKNAGTSSSILRGLEEELASAKLKRANDSSLYSRQKNLWEQGIGSKAEFDNRQLAFELSRRNHEMAIARIQQSREELDQALTRARNNYQSTALSAEDYLLSSQINGKVYEIMKEPGELVSPQMPIASIGSNASFVLEMLIAEVDIVKVQLGQTILVALDAYPGELFKAKLSKIYPRKDERTQTFKVEGVFTDEPPRLYPGLSGEVNIVIRSKEQALVVPTKYINTQNQVRTDTGLTKVSTGLKNMEYTEILSGIDSSTGLHPLQ